MLIEVVDAHRDFETNISILALGCVGEKAAQTGPTKNKRIIPIVPHPSLFSTGFPMFSSS